jgi:hypothetical protein
MIRLLSKYALLGGHVLFILKFRDRKKQYILYGRGVGRQSFYFNWWSDFHWFKPNYLEKFMLFTETRQVDEDWKDDQAIVSSDIDSNSDSIGFDILFRSMMGKVSPD